MNPQLAGIEKLGGTYPFDLATSVRTLRINRFFWMMTQPAHRTRFVEDEAALMDEARLSDTERGMIRARDWIGMIRYGVNFFVLEKFARVLKLSNPHMYASMRGETLETFLATRNVPEAR
ncbi:MAG: protocatechuate 3,4-dioxygenase [Casimicrobiaceae bacterium]